MLGIVCRSSVQLLTSSVLFSRWSSVVDHPVKYSHWFASVFSAKNSLPLRAEPKKKKKVDPRRELMVKERLKKKLKKLEKIPPELIPIEDFITPGKCFDEIRLRSTPKQSFDKSECRALLLKQWSRYKHSQHKVEMTVIENALEVQKQALEELKLESDDLYKSAVNPDTSLFPFQQHGPCYTPHNPMHEAPEGKYNDITRLYTQ